MLFKNQKERKEFQALFAETTVSNCKHLEANKKSTLIMLLRKYKQLFDGTLGKWTGDPYHIELCGNEIHTNNLPLPMDAVSVKQGYEEAYNDVLINHRTGQTTNLCWSHVSHPIGQLLGYMVETCHQYGALSSGIRTYFLCICSDGNDAQVVEISDAWYVGPADYIQVRVYLHKLSSELSDPFQKETQGWQRETARTLTPGKKQSWGGKLHKALKRVKGEKTGKQGQDRGSGRGVLSDTQLTAELWHLV
jgi:hypothetical protein